MSYQNKERSVYPSIGKANFTDADAFINWYLNDGGYNWLNVNNNYKNLIYDRQTLFGDMVPKYRDMYCSVSNSDHYAAHYAGIIRSIGGYIRKFGGQYDVLLHEPELTVIQFGGPRLLIPTRFLSVTLYPDYKQKTLAELNRALIPEEQAAAQSQSEAMSVMGSLTIASLDSEMARQKQKLAAAEDEIKVVKAEQERKIEAIRAEARAAMQKIERMKLGLQVKVEELQTQVFMLESVIYSVESYIGDTVDFIQLRKGADAPIEAPFVIHQKLRYLDEDLPILISIYGFQFEKSEMFEDALKNRDDLMEYFCPGDKCMSFVRVSKTATTFGTDEQGMLAEYDMYHGKTVGILLRCRQDAYALTIWSIDDVPEINDSRAKKMSAADKEESMEFAQRQLKADMTERGWYSLGDLLDIFMSEKSDTDAPDV